MGAKRALIVDDSKSARVFLSRILEKYEIGVDSAENAEAAIEYLGNHRPDVIFMDHMMPGMDGFQAVQAIKNNPRTATIPIMMYTSQEGELYLGQARALGAVGVLPKQIKQADVSKVLYELHLVEDRRKGDQSSFKPANLEAVVSTAEGATVVPVSKPLTDTALREQFAELRRALVAAIDTQSERIGADVHTLLQDAMPNFQQPLGARESRAPWVIACLALVIALASAGLWWHEAKLRQQLVEELTQIKQAGGALATRSGAPSPLVTTPSSEDTGDLEAGDTSPSSSAAAGLALPPGSGVGPERAAPEGRALVVPVPYGDDALSGPRLEVLRQYLTRLSARGYRGTVEVRSFAGRYCLVGNANEGFSAAPDELPFARCNAVGNPHEESLPPAQRESLGFANLVGQFRSASKNAIEVEFVPGDASVNAVPYPPVTGALTAGEWNRAAAGNNRIEVRLR